MMTNNHSEADNSTLKSASTDFKVALVLLIASFFLVLETLTYPMSGDYAGVESQWYVSPALFPLVILLCLTLCALVLMYRAITQQGYRQFLSFSAWLGDFQEKRIRDRWYIIFLLAVYVYVYVPSVDFYLATVMFLMSLTTRFYYPTRNSLSVLLATNTLLLALIYMIKMHWFGSDELTFWAINQDDDVIFWSDSMTAAMITALLLLNFIRPKALLWSKAVTNALVVLIVPLVLIIIFNYLLFVPMPVEYGSVVSVLDYLVYEVLAL